MTLHPLYVDFTVLSSEINRQLLDMSKELMEPSQIKKSPATLRELAEQLMGFATKLEQQS